MTDEPEAYDPRRSVSVPLTEMRTVLSRARTAIEVIDGSTEFTTVRGVWQRPEGESRARYVGHETIPHPERDEMLEALRAFVAAAARWEKTGSRRRRGAR